MTWSNVKLGEQCVQRGSFSVRCEKLIVHSEKEMVCYVISWKPSCSCLHLRLCGRNCRDNFGEKVHVISTKMKHDEKFGSGKLATVLDTSDNIVEIDSRLASSGNTKFPTNLERDWREWQAIVKYLTGYWGICWDMIRVDEK